AIQPRRCHAEQPPRKKTRTQAPPPRGRANRTRPRCAHRGRKDSTDRGTCSRREPPRRGPPRWPFIGGRTCRPEATRKQNGSSTSERILLIEERPRDPVTRKRGRRRLRRPPPRGGDKPARG